MIRKLLVVLAGLLSLLLMAGCSEETIPGTLTSRDVVGAVVENPAGVRLGAVEDVIVDINDGQISYLIVELSPDGFSYTKAAFAPGSELRTAVPFQAFEVESQSRALVLTIDETLLEEAPLFSDDDVSEVWESSLQAYWRDRLD